MFFSQDDLTLELLGVFKLERRSFNNKSSDERYHDAISIRTSGCGSFTFGKRNVTVKKGDVLYIPQSAAYSQKSEGETIIAIHFINYNHSKNNSFEKLSPENCDGVYSLILEMYHIWNEKKSGYRYECTSLLYKLLYLLNRCASSYAVNSECPADRLCAAIDYIHKHYKRDKISVGHLASLCAVSETYFRQLFKKVYSVSPAQYIINLRMEYAAQLLQSRLYSVAQVSEKAGFNDVKYFERVFRTHFGTTPGRYKKQIPSHAFK